MLRFFRALTIVFLLAGIVGCGVAKPSSSHRSKASKVAAERAKLARAILKHPRITFMRKQVSGRYDGASAYHNLKATARGSAAKRSSYGGAPGGYKSLDIRMLRGIKKLADMGYRFNITSIAGGSHSRRSRHYAGIAFDVNYINGVKVGRKGCPHWRFRKAARRLGATEVLGPGCRGHSGHVHVAWPRR